MATITNGRLVHTRVTQQTQSTGHNLTSSRALTAIDRITVHTLHLAAICPRSPMLIIGGLVMAGIAQAIIS